MTENIIAFLAHWAITALSLWVASFIFRGITFSDKRSLFISALLLGLANAIIRPVLVLLTIPLTILTFGFFLLVINALMMLLVSSIVPGFKVSGFWTAFFASIFITLLSFFVGALIFQGSGQAEFVPAQRGLFVQQSPAPQEKNAFRPLPERAIYITMRGAVPFIQTTGENKHES